MTTQEHLPHTDIDIVDETSAQSFPASDALEWTIGRSYRPAPSTLATKVVLLTSASSTQKEEARRVRVSQHQNRTPFFG
jgi:hypothetical protein